MRLIDRFKARVIVRAIGSEIEISPGLGSGRAVTTVI